MLREKAVDIPTASIREQKIRRLIGSMKATLAATPDGVGLAAPQVGESLRLFIVSEEAEEVDRAEKGGWQRRAKENPAEKSEEPYKKRVWKYYVFINPIVKNRSRRTALGPEGCLSVPGKFGTVKRHEKITVEAHDEHGKKFTRGASRFFARVIQHELDHLDGTLFIDKAGELISVPPKEQKNDPRNAF
ncbi:MAG: peptide deformylase [Parcubacteria group bacterium Greene0714_36]|nr:MAG: peptide deformylase [Parcubacteria group bacterium Greene0714_36]